MDVGTWTTRTTDVSLSSMKGESMKLNHLAISARDVLASQRFYCAYFRFREGPGVGLLVSDDGFSLAIHESTESPPPPELNATAHHFGFFLPTRAEALSLYEKMRSDGVAIALEPRDHLGDVMFFCRDPAGWLVEVRGCENASG